MGASLCRPRPHPSPPRRPRLDSIHVRGVSERNLLLTRYIGLLRAVESGRHSYDEIEAMRHALAPILNVRPLNLPGTKIALLDKARATLAILDNHPGAAVALRDGHEVVMMEAPPAPPYESTI